MSLCEPLPLLRFLASSKALTDMARLNEATLYRRLYHRVLAKESRLRSPAQHCLYAPIKQKAAKKGSGAINYPISDPLPLDAVRSWKVSGDVLVGVGSELTNEQVQWTDTVRWYGHIVKAGKRDMRCMDCGAGKHDAVISEISEWNMRFCLLCYAKFVHHYLVPLSTVLTRPPIGTSSRRATSTRTSSRSSTSGPFPPSFARRR